MWTSTRSSSLRNARSLPPKINGGSNHNMSSDVTSLRLLESDLKLTRRARTSRINGFRFRLRYDPSHIRIRNQFPDPEIPPIAEHRHSECLHLRRDTSHPPCPFMGRYISTWVWSLGFVFDS